MQFYLLPSITRRTNRTHAFSSNVEPDFELNREVNIWSTSTPLNAWCWEAESLGYPWQDGECSYQGRIYVYILLFSSKCVRMIATLLSHYWYQRWSLGNMFIISVSAETERQIQIYSLIISLFMYIIYLGCAFILQSASVINPLKRTRKGEEKSRLQPSLLLPNFSWWMYLLLQLHPPLFLPQKLPPCVRTPPRCSQNWTEGIIYPGTYGSISI